jgi:hypothetical protein
LNTHVINTQTTTEALEFLFAVESYENGGDALDALELVSLYVQEQSRKELNISREARNSFMRDNPLLSFDIVTDSSLLLHNNYDREKVFNKLKKRVKIQLQQEKIPQFLRSQYFLSYGDRSSTQNKKMKWLLGDEVEQRSSCKENTPPTTTELPLHKVKSLKRLKRSRSFLISPRKLLHGLSGTHSTAKHHHHDTTSLM